ncbi:MAG: hypothetical protein ACRC25_13405 [Aeromonas hydrophila]
MSCALCLCPEFIGQNIQNPQAYANIFIGSIINTDCQVVLDATGRLEYEYTNAVKDNVNAFEFYKAWWGVLSSTQNGKILPVNIRRADSESYIDVVYDVISVANTTFNKNIVAHSNNNYERYIEELRRQRIELINLQNVPAYTLPNLKKKKATYTDVDKDLAWVLHRLIRTHDIGNSENAKNDFVRSMMLAKDYFLVDQSREGDSPSGVDAGELDLLINDENGFLFTIIEALKLSSVESNRINEHYLKLLNNYNPLSVKLTFLVSYYNGKNFSSWWPKYKEHIMSLHPTDIGLSEDAEVVDVVEVPTNYINLKKLVHYFSEGGESFSCIHYAVKAINRR